MINGGEALCVERVWAVRRVRAGGVGVCVSLLNSNTSHSNRRPPARFAVSPARPAFRYARHAHAHAHAHDTHTHTHTAENEREGDVPWIVTTAVATAADGRGNAKQHFWVDRPRPRRERERKRGGRAASSTPRTIATRSQLSRLSTLVRSRSAGRQRIPRSSDFEAPTPRPSARSSIHPSRNDTNNKTKRRRRRKE
jgi:hypothetical protein